MPDGISTLTLGGFVAVNLLAAASGGVFKPGEWYRALTKPSWTPPNWAFPVVWSLLYFTNAVAGWLVWEAAPANQAMIFLVYGVSLLVNAGWSAFFFGAKRMDLAMIDVSVLWLSILAQIILFWTVMPIAALMTLPYLAWVSTASFLNLRMIQLNR